MAIEGVESLEAEVERLEALAAQRQEQVRRRNRKVKASGLQLEEEFAQGVEDGELPDDTRSPVEILKDLLDTTARRLEYMEIHNGEKESYTGPNYYANLCTQKGRVQGLAAAVAALSNSTVKREMLSSIERRVENERD